MAFRVFQYVAVIPAGTLPTAPATTHITLDNWVIESIDLEVLPGPSGLMGFYVANNSVQWIPQSPGTWLVWDDVQMNWPMSDQPDGSGWAIVGYNTGTYDHSVTARFHVNQPAQPTVPPPTFTIITSDLPARPVVTL